MKPGRLRKAAAEILADNGVFVRPEDIHPMQGYWKWHDVDVFPWMVNVPNRGYLGCWQTLTAFVKNAKAGGKVIIGNGIDSVDGEVDIVCWPPERKNLAKLDATA